MPPPPPPSDAAPAPPPPSDAAPAPPPPSDAAPAPPPPSDPCCLTAEPYPHEVAWVACLSSCGPRLVAVAVKPEDTVEQLIAVCNAVLEAALGDSSGHWPRSAVEQLATLSSLLRSIHPPPPPGDGRPTVPKALAAESCLRVASGWDQGSRVFVDGRVLENVEGRFPHLRVEDWCQGTEVLEDSFPGSEHGSVLQGKVKALLAKDLQQVKEKFELADEQSPELKKLINEIADKLDSNGDGKMQEYGLQILVKHTDPNYINVPTEKIQICDPKIKALVGEDKAALSKYLADTYEENWIKVFHAFLGLGEKKTGFPASTPGVYEVIWEGGVRYRTAPKYQSIADQEQLALPQTQYEIEDFVTGEDGIEYGYLYWARYFLPMRFQNGQPMLKKIGELGDPEQLVSLAKDLIKEIDTSGDGLAALEEITSFLDGCEIAYDSEMLEQAFKPTDARGASLEELIECLKHKAIANLFCIPTQTRQTVPHHPCLSDRPWFEEANAKIR